LGPIYHPKQLKVHNKIIDFH